MKRDRIYLFIIIVVFFAISIFSFLGIRYFKSRINVFKYDSKKIAIRGSETLLGLNYEWAKYYTNKYKDKKFKIEITGGGSGVGIVSMINEIVDFASSSREIKDKEIQIIKFKNKILSKWEVALDAIIIYVHKDNKINTISLKNLEDIYLGNIKNWKELGGEDKKIIPYGRESSSGTYEFFKEKVLNGQDFFDQIISLSGNATIINSIKKDKYGIGYGAYSHSSHVKKLAIRFNDNEIYPSEKNIKDKSYFLVRSLYLYAILQNIERKTYVLDYINWILSDEAQNLCIKSGYFSINSNKVS